MAVLDFVIGPDGRKLTIEDLPSPRTTRWVNRRKAQVVAAVKGGLLSFEDARQRYRLTWEEYLTWEQALRPGGVSAPRADVLRQTRDH